MSTRTKTPAPATSAPKTQAPAQTVSTERIAARAYEKWCGKGCPEGTNEQDWFEAEAELRSETAKTYQASANRR